MISTPFGLVHLYVGDGKGKTTAAMGLAMRTIGAGQKVLIAQFLKGKWTSELSVLQQLKISVVRTEEIKKPAKKMTPEQLLAATQSCGDCLQQVCSALKSGDFGLVVLDEIVDAVNEGFVDASALVQMIADRHLQTEVVMTGRNPKDEIIDAADYLTVMSALKHPKQKGIGSRRGIEY